MNKRFHRLGLHFASTITVLTYFFAAFTADAQATLVAVFYSPPCPLLLDMEAELRAAGFLPILIKEQNDTVPLPEAAASAHTHAAVRILSSDREVAVFAADPSNLVFLSTNVTTAANEGRKSAVLAIKTVETLRVGLMQIREEAAFAPSLTTSTPISPGPAALKKPVFLRDHSKNGLVLFAVAPSVTFGFGDIPPSLHLALNLTVKPMQRLRLFIFGLAPTAASKVHSDIGSANVREGLVAMGMSAELRPSDRRVLPYIGLIGGALFVSAKGRANGPLHGEETNGVAGVAAGQAGTAVRLTRIIFLRADLSVGIAFPKPVIRFDGEAVASFGRPFISGSFGIEAVLK
jgi:hypothetical protein